MCRHMHAVYLPQHHRRRHPGPEHQSGMAARDGTVLRLCGKLCGQQHFRHTAHKTGAQNKLRHDERLPQQDSRSSDELFRPQGQLRPDSENRRPEPAEEFPHRHARHVGVHCAEFSGILGNPHLFRGTNLRYIPVCIGFDPAVVSLLQEQTARNRLCQLRVLLGEPQ